MKPADRCQWKCRTCGAPLGGRDVFERSRAQIEHARDAGHRAALEPVRPRRSGWGGLPVGLRVCIAAAVGLFLLGLGVSLAQQQAHEDAPVMACARNGPSWCAQR